MQLPKNLYNAGMVACREQDIMKPIPSGVYSDEGGDDTAETLRQHIYDYNAKIEGTDWAVYIDEDVVKAAVFRKDASSDYFGTYPHGNTEKREFNLEKAINYAETGEWS